MPVPKYWTLGKRMNAGELQILAQKLLECQGICKTFLAGVGTRPPTAEVGGIHLRRGTEKGSSGDAHAILAIVPGFPDILYLSQVSTDWSDALIANLNSVGLTEIEPKGEYELAVMYGNT